MKRSRAGWVGIGLAAFWALAAMAASAPVTPRAQEDVTGLPPVFSSPPKTQEKQPPGNREKNPEIRVRSNLVVTPVTVLDASGQYVYDLAESDFRVLDNGEPQRIQSFEPETRPLAAVIVIQDNRAVEPLLDDVKPLAPVFTSLMLGPQGQAAVVTYDDRIHLAQDFASDGDRLAATLHALRAQGVNARLNDALMRAIALLEKRPTTERRVVVVFSEGFDHGSESKNEEVIRRATGSDVTIYGLGFNPMHSLLARTPELSGPGPLDTNVARPTPPGRASTPSSSTNVYDAPIPVVDIMVATGEVIKSVVASSLLEAYAGYTGGVYYSHWKKKTVEDQLSRIAEEIHSQYELAYVPNTPAQGGFHKIEVRVMRPGVKVRARAGYFFQMPSPAGAPAPAPSPGNPQ